jgi:hypothetical protein
VVVREWPSRQQMASLMEVCEMRPVAVLKFGSLNVTVGYLLGPIARR